LITGVCEISLNTIFILIYDDIIRNELKEKYILNINRWLSTSLMKGCNNILTAGSLPA
jgi:hypothetical protein